MKQLFFCISMLIIFFVLPAQVERDQIDDKYKWDLTDIYPSDEAWNESKELLIKELDKVESFKGTLTKSSAQLLKAMEYSTKISKEAIKLSIYAGMHSDLDTRDMHYLGMRQEVQQLFASFGAKASFIDPEILSVEWEVIAKFIEEEPLLEPYEKGLSDLFRLQLHTPDEAEGRIIALSGMVSGVPSSVYSTFINAEMPKAEVSLSTGESVTLDSPGFGKYRALANRDDRALVFESFFGNLENYQATLGELLYGGIKRDVYYSKAHNYNSSLERALYPNNIPTDVYHSLVKGVNENLGTFHRYLGIKKRMMGLDTLKYLDLYAPVVKDVNLTYDFEEAQKILLKALAPLGEEYIAIVEKAFNERWIDVYPAKGKSAGAYSNGAFYDGHPYILLNYNDLYSDMSTAAHELGHTMQSYFSNKTQPYPTSRYTTFVAEVASTFNEVLLFDYIIDEITEDDIKLSLLMDRLNGFKGTLFRQTQFAEYELKIHEAVEKGIPLTGKYLSELYLEVVRKYYGHDQGVCHVDDYIHMEWGFIPHFYYNYYVYQYSTSFTASVSLAQRLLDGEKGARERYLEFISAGGSDDPIDLLKIAGVDMTGTDVFTATIAAMNELMDQMDEILDRRDKTLP